MTSLREAHDALAAVEANAVRQLPDPRGAPRGGLSPRGARRRIIDFEDGPDGRERLRFMRHPGCDRRSFVIGWARLNDLAVEAREQGQMRFLI